MKKLFLFAGLMFLLVQAYPQAVQRNQVVVEIGTGTWCTYCPGAANGAHDLLANGCQVAVIENHNGDAFANTYSDARNNYYGITGFPTAFFDGVLNHVGGQACPNPTVYAAYLPLYNARYSVPSPVVIDISGTSSGNTYTIVISLKKLATISGSDLRLHFVLTESDIATAPWPGSGGCMNKVDHVNRIMVPNENGTAVSFTSGDFQIINLTFDKDASWVSANCELVAFLQDNTTKETFNGTKVALNNLPPPVSVDFTGTPTTGCIPMTVNYTDQSAGVNTYQWVFGGGTPGTSTNQNPAVTYNTAGIFDVTLTAWNSTNNRGNKKVRTSYISVGPPAAAPGTPVGTTSLCQNPGASAYTTTTVTGATGYTWNLTPSTAGTLTPNGTTCTVNWDPSYLGTASLKVQGTNTCGGGPWSPSTSITISAVPGQPGDPTGPTSLCMNPPNSTYTTSGTPNASQYTWELIPAYAGTTSGTGTTCTVNWSDTFTGTAQLHVSAMNGVCSSPWSNFLDITVIEGPTAFNITGGGAYCAQGGTGQPVGVDNSQTSVNYTLYLDNTTTGNTIPGTGSAISFGNQMTAGTYTVKADNAGCSNTMNGSAVVSVDPQEPGTPGNPTGPGTVYSGSNPTSDYITSGGLYATSYTWELTPTEAGTISGNTLTGVATWDPGYEGPAQVKVQGVNSCGGGSFSTEYSVEVHPGFVGIGENGKNRYFSVHPNPVKGILTISSPEPKKADISVISPLGKTVVTKTSQTIGTSYQLDLSGLAPGVYTLTLRNEGSTETIKIVVK